MCLLKVLFKLNLVPCRESWYTTKIISGKPLTYDILYKKEKERGKKTHLLRALLSLSLELMKMTYDSLSRSGTKPFNLALNIKFTYGYKYNSGMRIFWASIN